MPLSPTKLKSKFVDNSANINIDELYNQYVITIDSFRSRKLPELFISKDQGRDLSIDEKYKKAIADANRGGNVSSEPEETRASAFYRMIGFPISSNNDYYNPGFSPDPAVNNKINVNESLIEFNSDILKQTILRENEFKEKIGFLQRRRYSSLYVEAMNYYRPFNLIDPESTDSNNTVSKDRENQINKSSLNLQNGSIIINSSEFPDFVYKSINHRLKPFFCNPYIDLGIVPASNRICVPFLKNKQETNFNETISLKRPIIELIIRTRLQDLETTSVIDSFNQETDEEEFETLLTVSANSEDRLKILNSNLSTQSQMLVQFSNILISLANKFRNNVNLFNEIKAKHNCYLLPGDGVYALENLNKMNVIFYNSTEEAKIYALKLEQTITNNIAQNRESAIGGISSYAGTAGLDGKIKRDFNQEISRRENELISIKDQFKRLVRENEIISGEVSGLGLIDIFAIYSALWVIPIETLISFLDLSSLERLESNFKELYNTTPVQNVKTNRKPISEVYIEFSNTLSNILDNVQSIIDGDV